MKTHLFRDIQYEKFMESKSYGAFMKFARYIIDVNAISHKEFITHMVKSNIPVDKWATDKNYLEFVKKILMNETPYRALERTVILMQEWAIKEETKWETFFSKVSPVLAVQWITSGRLSPWVFLNCRTGIEMLERMSQEQKSMIENSVNTKVWLGKFSRHTEAVKDIKQTLLEEGL
jgi:hypothetical protein